MHKLMEYICDELDSLERKVEESGNLSSSELQYVDMLTQIKKNLLKTEEMMGEDYSMTGGSYRDYAYESNPTHMGSYARRNRGMRRNHGANQYGSYNMGYSRETEGMVDELRDLMQDAPDEKTRKEFEKFIHKVEQM